MREYGSGGGCMMSARAPPQHQQPAGRTQPILQDSQNRAGGSQNRQTWRQVRRTGHRALRDGVAPVAAAHRPHLLVVCFPQARPRRLASPNTAERERGGHAWKVRVRKRRARGKLAVPAPSRRPGPPAPFPPPHWRVLSQAQPPERIVPRKNSAASGHRRAEHPHNSCAAGPADRARDRDFP